MLIVGGLRILVSTPHLEPDRIDTGKYPSSVQYTTVLLLAGFEKNFLPFYVQYRVSYPVPYTDNGIPNYLQHIRLASY